MDAAYLRRLLDQVRASELDIEDVLRELLELPYENIGIARIDHHRALRTGFPEIVFGDSKTPAQAVAIMERLANRNDTVLCTRASHEIFAAVQGTLPHAVYHELARMIVVRQPSDDRERLPGIVIASAGTGDLRVAEEAALTAEAMGHLVERINDVGVAGLHRLLDCVDRLREAHVVIAVAGMEGALPGVVAGLVDVPVIAVPTSVGYGTSFGGVSALLTMLNSCAIGLTVVNIDNGVGAGAMAAMINRQSQGARRGSMRRETPSEDTGEPA
jgi:pyridinium-3,5-biscarboxylic acid mononucleotide synthase